jgi:hypothetical protein
MWEKEISLAIEDPLGRDTLAGSLSLNNQRGNIMMVVLVMVKRGN